MDLNNYVKIPVGKAKDYTDQVINDFLILYRIEQPKEFTTRDTYWIGQCLKCKQYKVLTGQVLRRGKIQCDCLHDLTGKIFGRWTVLYDTKKTTKNRQKIWHCKCQCGNEKDVDAWTLTSGQSQSCGCYQKEKAKIIGHSKAIDITGQRFGKLVALYPIYSNEKSQHTKWHCHCDCGNEVDIDLGNLRQGFSQSCGCQISTQETRIIQLLTKADIQFQYQYHFKDLPFKSFDFLVNNNYIIEFDGAQHFGYNGYGWNTQENFIKTHESDKIKNSYCFENNIPIIRIPYTQKDIFNLEDLQLNTSKFLLTKDNEDEYYQKHSFKIKEKNIMEHMNTVDFTVPLSGSQIFDYHAYVTAKHLCDLFPPLTFDMGEKKIHIYGELNDFWYDRWVKAVFNTIGNYEA